MADREILRTIDRAQNEVLRTRILRIVEVVYPKWIARAVVFSTLQKSQIDTLLNDLDINAHYLAEKGLLQIEETKGKSEKTTWRIKLTARGIDYFEGRLEEIGLASPDLVDQSAEMADWSCVDSAPCRKQPRADDLSSLKF